MEILRRLEACETDLEAHRGYLKALEYGLRAALIVHPDPSELSAIWSQLLPGIADAHAEAGTAVYTAALQQALALLTSQIAEAAGLDTHGQRS